MITIVDYGMGNLGSITNMLKRIGIKSCISNNADVIRKAEKLLLPGVGAFNTAMLQIQQLQLVDALNEAALQRKIPVLGICLGMQLMTEYSEEGNANGLNWINATTKRFEADNIKVPHMGWNTVSTDRQHVLNSDLPEDTRFYFVHSYYVSVAEPCNSIMKTTYGLTFDSAITNGDNIFGAQFHPEKSHKYGMRFLENFAGI